MNKKMKCVVSLANLMSEASHKSELLTQLWLNDKVELIEENEIWLFIRNKFNGTKGWALKSQFVETDDETYSFSPLSISYPDGYMASDVFIPGTFHDEQADEKNGFVTMQTIGRDENTMRSILFHFLEAPYMWGGVTTYGIDCSGLSQVFYRFYDMALTSFAAEQFKQGVILDFIQDARIGDLAFFENTDGLISHVGVMLNPDEIIHASEKAGKVVVDLIDHEGIINRQSGKRTHTLRVVKRYM